jgi:hypothetical protein
MVPCRFYVTPKSYLDLISLYLQLLAQRRQELHAARDRLLNGLGKLQEANEVVDRMQGELALLQPVLVEKTAATQELLMQVRHCSSTPVLRRFCSGVARHTSGLGSADDPPRCNRLPCSLSHTAPACQP